MQVKLSLDSWRWLSFATQAANLEKQKQKEKSSKRCVRTLHQKNDRGQ